MLVDSDNDLSFADESFMTDYKVNYDIGHFGHDNPATPVSESVPFVVQTDPGEHAFVGIGIVSGAHGTHVSGIAAGNSLFGGQMSGAAPGAKIAMVRACLFTAGCTAHALTEGMIYLIETDHVDVVNMSIGGLPALNDGNNTRGILYNRLIEDNDVQMFISAGNDGPGTNTIGDPGVVSKVMGVGAYIHKDTWRRNYGSDSPARRQPASVQLAWTGGGRRAQAADRGSGRSDLFGADCGRTAQPVGGTYTLPPGYGMFNGTSMASPQAAGAAALADQRRQAGASHARLRRR